MRRDLAVVANARHRLRHGVGILVNGKDFRALAREQHRGGAAIAPAGPNAACPGDERDLSGNASRHEAFPSFLRADVSGALTAAPASTIRVPASGKTR